jgi:2-hydroxy-3-oxopropionate reductase
MSSISPLATKEFARRIRQSGAGHLDAPVSGGEVGARNAALTIMVGGSEADYASAKPFFELMGKNVTLVGENGDGQTAKVANQIIVALTIEAVGEALLFASKAGADPAKVRQALSWEDLRRLGFLSFTASGYLNETLHRDSASNCIRRIWRWLLEAARVLGLSLPNTATCGTLQ